MEKLDLIKFLLSLFFLAVALISVIYGNFFYFGVFLALSLGLMSFRQYNGMVIASTGLLVFYVSIFKFENIIPWYVGIIIVLFGIFYVFVEIRKRKEEIRQILLDKGLAKNTAEIKISFVKSFRYVSIARKTFNTYFNPSKMAVKIEIGKNKELYFYDFRKKELYEANQS